MLNKQYYNIVNYIVNGSSNIIFEIFDDEYIVWIYNNLCLDGKYDIIYKFVTEYIKQLNKGYNNKILFFNIISWLINHENKYVVIQIISKSIYHKFISIYDLFFNLSDKYDNANILEYIISNKIYCLFLNLLDNFKLEDIFQIMKVTYTKDLMINMIYDDTFLLIMFEYIYYMENPYDIKFYTTNDMIELAVRRCRIIYPEIIYAFNLKHKIVCDTKLIFDISQKKNLVKKYVVEFTYYKKLKI